MEDAIHGVRESERFGPGEEGGRANNARRWLPQVQKPAPAPAPAFNFPKIPFGAGGFSPGALGNAPPLGGAVDNSSSRSVTQTINNNVKIDGGGDPAAAANHMERSLGRTSDLSLRNAQSAIR